MRRLHLFLLPVLASACTVEENYIFFGDGPSMDENTLTVAYRAPALQDDLMLSGELGDTPNGFAWTSDLAFARETDLLTHEFTDVDYGAWLRWSVEYTRNPFWSCTYDGSGQANDSDNHNINGLPTAWYEGLELVIMTDEDPESNGCVLFVVAPGS